MVGKYTRLEWWLSWLAGSFAWLVIGLLLQLLLGIRNWMALLILVALCLILLPVQYFGSKGYAKAAETGRFVHAFIPTISMVVISVGFFILYCSSLKLIEREILPYVGVTIVMMLALLVHGLYRRQKAYFSKAD